MKRPGLALAIAAVAAQWPTDARACVGTPTVGGRFSLMPREGVPTNAVVRVVYYHGRDNRSGDLQLRSADGAAVPFSSTGASGKRYSVSVLIPAAPFAANTTYELLDRRSGDTSCWDDAARCYSTEWRVFATFRTSDRMDTTAPVFAGLTGVSTTCRDDEDVDSCGVRHEKHHVLELLAPFSSGPGYWHDARTVGELTTRPSMVGACDDLAAKGA